MMISFQFLIFLCVLSNIYTTPINQKQSILSTPNQQVYTTTTQKNTQAPLHSTTAKTNAEAYDTVNIDPISPTIFGVTRLFYCIKDENCQKIVEFSLAGNYSYNCLELFLPIEYNIYHLNRKYPSFGYLSLNEYEIMETQKFGQYCKKISRYFLKFFFF